MENIYSRTKFFAVRCGLRLVHLQKFTSVNKEGSVSAFTRRNSLRTFGKKFLIVREQIFPIF